MQIGLVLTTAKGFTTGCHVDKITKDSAADSAGLQPGDIITQADGTVTKTQKDATAILRKLKPGDRVPLIVERKGRLIEISLIIGAVGYSLKEVIRLCKLANEDAEEVPIRGRGRGDSTDSRDR